MTRVACIFVLVASFLASIGAGQALAIAPPAPIPVNPALTADYRGWAYVVAPQSATAWKWTPEGWQSTTLPSGASVWAHEWTAPWTWAYRGGAWYAMKVDSLSAWSCTGLPSAISLRTGNATAYRFNSTASQRYEIQGTVATRVCENTFTDATVPSGISDAWHARGMALVRTRVGYWRNPCAGITDPNIACAAVVYWTDLGERSVYVPTSELGGGLLPVPLVPELPAPGMAVTTS